MLFKLQTIHALTGKDFLIEDSATSLILCGLEDVKANDVVQFPDHATSKDWFLSTGNLKAMPEWKYLRCVPYWQVQDTWNRFSGGVVESFARIVPIVNLDHYNQLQADNVIPLATARKSRA